jgi:ferredoxin
MQQAVAVTVGRREILGGLIHEYEGRGANAVFEKPSRGGSIRSGTDAYSCAIVQVSGGDGFPESIELERLTDAFRLLSDPGRLRLVVALLEDRELPVRELASVAALSMTAASQQLRILREAGVVRRRRHGRHARKKVLNVTYIIAEPCIDVKDRSCVDVCPVDCIHEFERMLVIDPEECIDCGACEPECPVEAIFPEDALPDKWESFVKINYAFPQGADAVNQLVAARIEESPPPPIDGYRE